MYDLIEEACEGLLAHIAAEHQLNR